MRWPPSFCPRVRLTRCVSGCRTRHRGSRSCLSQPRPWRPSPTTSIPASAAIALAEILHADLLLIDEAAGRAEAKRRHLRVTGTLGVLRAGAELGLVNVPNLIARLQATSFYVDEALLEAVFEPWLRP